MNLYLIEPIDTMLLQQNYDIYKKALVVAENENEAKLIHPSYENDWDTEDTDITDWPLDGDYYSWVESPDQVKVTYVGVADELYTKKMIIIVDFQNA